MMGQRVRETRQVGQIRKRAGALGDGRDLMMMMVMMVMRLVIEMMMVVLIGVEGGS